MFKSYIHVERLTSPAVEGILNGKCFVTAKLDGTNASVFWDIDGVSAGSRNRKLSYEKDNAGFYAWLMSDNEEAVILRKFVTDNPRLHVFGEFGVGKVGSIKYYASEAKEYVRLFDVYDDYKSRYLNWEEMKTLFEFYNLDKWMVQLLGVYENPTMEDLEDCLSRNNFLVVNNDLGEGIVIKNYDFKDQYGHFQMAKIVRTEYQQRKKNKKSGKSVDNLELEIVQQYLTVSELSKNICKTSTFFNNEFNPNDCKYVGYYMNLCWTDSILGETVNWCKKYKNPLIDMSKLYSITKEFARKFIGIN